ncbi:hypothetical protein, partial [Helicobacter heilmannii]|uniref:hypothetical protein n=1 Tax=Helicobacter heilmannii TaxID=35817 RepID=UPI001E61E75B
MQATKKFFLDAGLQITMPQGIHNPSPAFMQNTKNRHERTPLKITQLKSPNFGKKNTNNKLWIWWRIAGSNRWPPACKAGALP